MGRVVIPTTPRDAALTLSELQAQCLTYLGGVQHYAPGTVEQYARTYRQFLHHLTTQGSRDDLRAFTAAAVLSFMTDLGGRGVHPNTIIRMVASLSTLAQFGMRLRDERGKPRLSENPTRGVPWPSPIRTETQFLHPSELRGFLDGECRAHAALARDVLLDTGLRVTEACELTVGDFLEVSGQHSLAVRVKGRKRRGEERKHVPVSQDMARALVDALLARGLPDPGEPLLVNASGRRWTRTYLSQTMTRLGVKAGITRFRVSAHKLRHTANVIGRLSGQDALVRSAMLTHSNPRTLERYDHLVPGELHQARERQRAALGQYIGRHVSHESQPSQALDHQKTFVTHFRDTGSEQGGGQDGAQSKGADLQ